LYNCTVENEHVRAHPHEVNRYVECMVTMRQLRRSLENPENMSAVVNRGWINK
jgi:hypothetical protein